MGRVIAKESGPLLPDLPTVTAIALVAYAASNVMHELVGHGGACLALGGKALVLSSVHFECGEQAMSSLALRGVAAAGTIVNFIIGALALVVFKTADAQHRPHAAYFLWLFATLNLLGGAGYFLFSGVGGIGDWADVARGTMSPLIWRPAMSIFGGAFYFLLARQSAQRLRSLASSGEFSMKRSKRLTVPAYIAGGLLYCLAGLFNPVGPVLIAISAAASSFGGASGLLWLTQFLRRVEHPAPPAAALGRSYVWIVAGCIVSLMFVAILGPSIRWDSRPEPFHRARSKESSLPVTVSESRSGAGFSKDRRTVHNDRRCNALIAFKAACRNDISYDRQYFRARHCLDLSHSAELGTARSVAARPLAPRFNDLRNSCNAYPTLRIAVQRGTSPRPCA